MSRRCAVGVLVALAVLTGCTTGGSSDEDGATAAPELCEDFSFVPCPRQTATIRLPLTGSDFSLVYASDRAPGRTAVPSVSASQLGLAGWSLDVLHSYDKADDVLVLGDGDRRLAEAISLPAGDGDATLAVGSVSGAEVYLFDEASRHVATQDAITGTRLLAFAWGEHGLESVTEPGDRTTTVVRDDRGDMVAIESARGYFTRFGVRDGWLAAAADATGNLTRISTSTDGLVTAVTPAEGGSTQFDYDDDGRLVAIEGPGSRAVTLARRDIEHGFEVILTTGAERTEVVRVRRQGDEIVRTHIDAAGLTTEVHVEGDLRRVTSADGSTIEIELAPDPLWGMSAPIVAQVETSTSGGRHQVVQERRSSDASGPSVEPAAVTRSIEIDGAIWMTTYEPAEHQVRRLDPGGLAHTTTLDEVGRAVRVEADGAATREYQYSAGGVLEAMTMGSGFEGRVWRYGYDTSTGSVTVTDPIGAVRSFTSDPNGRVTQLTAPGAGLLTLERDALGRIVGVSPPSGATFGVSYGAAGDVELTTRPPGATGLAFTSFGRDVDGAVTSVAHSDVAELTVARDASGRSQQVVSGDDHWQMTYTATGAVERVKGPDATLAFDVDAGTIVGERWSGPFDAGVSRELDLRGQLLSVTVDDGDAVTYEYDDVGRVQRAGVLEVTRDPDSGRITEEHLGSLVRRWQYNGFGEVTGITAEVAGRTVHALTVERDGLGRVVRRTEVDGDGVSRMSAYGYDLAGRLASTVVDGGPPTTYTYDANGNLIQEVKADGSVVTSTYAGDDTLVQRGDATYTHDRAGRLETVTTPQGRTSYHYDLLGNLLSVTAPSGQETTYVVDGAGRRIARRGDIGPARGFVYLDGTRPAAMLDEDGQVLSSFTYSSGSPTPAYVKQGGRTLLVVTDDIGSPRALVDVEDGSTVWQLQTDDWGRPQSDIDFSQFPFGFAGGLADPGTTLLRFGARDYDPDAARWTAPDPIGFGGGDPNLYRYVGSNPVNRTDPSGLCDVESVGISGTLSLGRAFAISGGVGLVRAGKEGAVYSYTGAGLSTPAVGVSLTSSCLFERFSDKPSSPLDDFKGAGSTLDIGIGPFSFGGDVSGDPTDPSLAGAHYGAGVGVGVGGGKGSVSVQQTDTTLWWRSDQDLRSLKDRALGTLHVNLCEAGIGCSPGDGSAGASGALSVADPHLRTLDEVWFDFQAAGEFTALRSDSGDLLVQVRQQVRPPVRWVTWNTAAALEVLGDRLTFATTPEGWDVHLNANPIDPNGPVDLPGGGRLLVQSDGYAVTWPDGTTVRLVGSGRWSLDLQVAPARGRIGTLHGLLGPFTGETGNDTIEAADGATLDADARDDSDRLYRVFGDSWRISQDESRFDYREGESTATFTDLTIPDQSAEVNPDDASFAVCRAAGLTDQALAACALDVLVTGDASQALRTRRGFAAPPANVDGSSLVPAAVAGDVVDLDIGDSFDGTLASEEAVDHYRFTGDEGDVLLLVPDAGTPCVDTRITVYDPGGGRIADGGACDGVLFKLQSDGEYRLDVRVIDGATYRFALHRAPASEVSRIDVGDDLSGQLDAAGERHEYTFDADRGTAVFVAGTGDCEVRLQVFDSDDKPIADGAACLGLGRVLLAGGGDHRVVVSAPVTFEGRYTLSVLQSSVDQRFEISVGDEIGPGRPSEGAGVIDRPGAVDIYVFQGRAGEQVIVRGSAVPVCFWLRPWTDEGALQGLVSTCGEWPFSVVKDGPVEIRVGGDSRVGEYSFRLEAA